MADNSGSKRFIWQWKPWLASSCTCSLHQDIYYLMNLMYRLSILKRRQLPKWYCLKESYPLSLIAFSDTDNDILHKPSRILIQKTELIHILIHKQRSRHCSFEIVMPQLLYAPIQTLWCAYILVSID